MKGYKAFDKDLKCRGFQFEIGKTYTEENISICNKGFHFCEQLLDVYNYYDRNEETRICEVEASGKTLKENDKSCTSEIKIIRELSHKEILSAVFKNRNSGYYNSGYYNSGHRNSGYYNSGDRNSGHYNSGYYNSGNYNSGDRNSGHYNSGNYNSGYFNLTDSTVRLFDKQTNIKFNSDKAVKINLILSKVVPILQWIPESLMTEKEKTDFIFYKTTGGYLKNTGKQDWKNVTKEDYEFIKKLPGFTKNKFFKLTGVKL